MEASGIAGRCNRGEPSTAAEALSVACLPHLLQDELQGPGADVDTILLHVVVVHVADSVAVVPVAEHGADQELVDEMHSSLLGLLHLGQLPGHRLHVLLEGTHQAGDSALGADLPDGIL